MLKAMLFVDADWLCASMLDLGQGHGKPDLQIDYRRLSGVLAEELGRRHHLGPIDVVRSHYFASRRHDHEAHDPALLQRRRAFLARLHEEPHVELEMVDVDHGGGAAGRDGETTSENPAVPVALAVVAMRHALTPGVLDLAIFLLGDRCFAPLLRELRRLGRRVALVSVNGSCAAELADPANPLRACDFDVLWLHEVVGRIEKWRGRRPARAEEDDAAPSEDGAGLSLRGRIKNVIWDRGYGFIAAEDGRDYFFHINALEQGSSSTSCSRRAVAPAPRVWCGATWVRLMQGGRSRHQTRVMPKLRPRRRPTNWSRWAAPNRRARGKRWRRRRRRMAGDPAPAGVPLICSPPAARSRSVRPHRLPLRSCAWLSGPTRSRAPSK
jgi:uncharacterized LabA/DUF88 family protein